MKKTTKQMIRLITMAGCMSFAAYGANLPILGGVISSTNVNAGSGDNFFMITVNDGDPLLTQNISVTGLSSNSSLLQITGVEYDQNNTFAIIHTSNTSPVTTTGVVTVTVSAIDADGTSSKSFVINIGDFYPKGAAFKVYDIVFWQHITPVKQKPSLEAVITTTSIPTDDEYYRPAKLTVGAGVVLLPWFPNDWSHFFTNAISGYIKPLVSGTYTFEIVSQDQAAFYFSSIPGGNIYASELRINCSGTVCGLAESLFSVDLEAGQYYPFHTADWLVFTKNFSLMWTGPGINTFQTIGAPYIYPIYDRVHPTAPAALTLVNKGVEFVTLKWKSATDNDKIAGYNLYRDGAKLISLPDSMYVVTGLGANTLYSYAVTSYDQEGNESPISNILSTSTYATDNIPPTPPTQITMNSVGDMSAEVSWTGASDVGSEVIGYYVYLNGNLYNTIYTTNSAMVLRVLVPTSINTVSVEAFDGAFNRSPKSAVTSFTTLRFDESFKSVGVKKAKLVIQPTAIARNPGLGMNFDWTNPDQYTGIWQQYMSDYQPSAIRWGGFEPNKSSFSATTGPGKQITIGKWLQYCHDNNAHPLFTCGVNDNTDWMLNPATFTRFMEYVGDPTGQTPGGSIRIAEGYLEPFLNADRPLVLEFGNEVWGAAVHYAPIGANYSNYGNWCREMAAIIKSSPYYDPSKIILSYSGRNPDPAESYGLHIALLANDHHEVDWLSLSGYMGGNLNYDTNVPQGDTELEYYQSGTSTMLHNLSGLKETMDADVIRSGTYRPTFFYEGNMTTPDYNGRMGQAVIMVDYYLSAMKLGNALPSLFGLSGGEWSMTDASNGNAKLPLFNLSELINKNTKGNILKSDVKTLELLDDGTGLKISGDPVGIHVFNNGRKYAVAMFSRDYDSDYQVQLILPKNGDYSPTAQKYIVTGSDFSTRTATTSLTTVPLTDSMIVTIPQYSALLYLFDGPDLGIPLLPLGYTKYLKIDEVKIKTLSGTSDISVQYGSAVFTVTAPALTVIDKRIGWDIAVPPALNVSIDTTNGIRVFGSGTCDGNGVVTITAFSMEDPYVRDQVLVSITGQVDEGLETCEYTEGVSSSINSKVMISPNPTDGALNLFSSALQMTEVKIYSSSGMLVLEKSLKGGLQSHQLQLGNLSSGLYLVKINTSKGVVTRKVKVN